MGSLTADMAVLHAVEADTRIFEPEIEGFALWPILRLRVWQMLTDLHLDPFRGSLWRRLVRKPAEFARPAYALLALAQRRRLRGRSFDFIFFSSEAYRSVKRADGWWDVYLDDIARHPSLAGRVMRCEIRHFAFTPWRTVAPRHLFMDAQLLDQVLGSMVAKDPEADAQARRVSDILRDKLAESGRPLDEETYTRFLRFSEQRARMFRRSLKWYGRLFAEHPVRALVTMDAYNFHGVVGAARHRGIPVVEFQHGVIYAEHPGYIWATALRRLRDRLAIPDRIATYGDYWSQILTANGFWEPERITSVGLARLDWVRQNAGSKPLSTEALKIVFTSQQVTRPAAIRWLSEFIDHAEKAGLHYRLIIKVHRMELPFMAEYQTLARQASSVSVLSPCEGDTLALIAGADVHVSGWSTCHYEAVGLDTATIIAQFAEAAKGSELEHFPGVFQARSARELFEIVSRVRTGGDAGTQMAERPGDRLFKTNAVENAVGLLEEYAARPSQATAVAHESSKGFRDPASNQSGQ